MGVSYIKGTILGLPIIRTIVFWGLYWGPPILGNYHMFRPKGRCRHHICNSESGSGLVREAWERAFPISWVAVKGLKLSYHNGYI